MAAIGNRRFLCGSVIADDVGFCGVLHAGVSCLSPRLIPAHSRLFLSLIGINRSETGSLGPRFSSHRRGIGGGGKRLGRWIGLKK
ncbi:hypothetical protein D3C80_1868180 [compost metagenome]